jgi:hypothetical protein
VQLTLAELNRVTKKTCKRDKDKSGNIYILKDAENSAKLAEKHFFKEGPKMAGKNLEKKEWPRGPTILQ